MRQSWVAKLSAAALGLVLAGAAGAQSFAPLGLSVRAGVFLPTSGDARDAGNSWFAGGIDYKLSSLSLPAPGIGSQYLSLSADYYEKDSFRAIPIAINYNLRMSKLVYSIGVGVDFDRVGSDSTGIGGQAAISYELGPSPTPVFLQLKYFVSSKSDLDGFAGYVGVKF